MHLLYGIKEKREKNNEKGLRKLVTHHGRKNRRSKSKGINYTLEKTSFSRRRKRIILKAQIEFSKVKFVQY